MIHVTTEQDTYAYKISTRLLMQEALRKGYALTFFPSSPSTESGITRGVKDGQELFFKSTCSALVPSYGVFAAENKALTYSLLSMNDVSTPETIVLGKDDSADEAVAFLEQHKKLVVKPVDTNHGDGITVNVTDREMLERAIEFAREAKRSASDVIIQQQVTGDEYRFLVVEGRVIAVASRRPPRVVGDGVSTVARLIEEKNKDPRRGRGHINELTLISMEDVMHHRGESLLESIPAKGEIIEVLDTSNLSRGGEALDVTDEASPSLKKLAEKAAAYCFLGIAGVDIMTKDITADTDEDSYVIEVNLTPGIRMHQFPSEGTPRNVTKTIFAAIEKTARPIGKPVQHVGPSEKIAFPELSVFNIPARIDTGATLTSIWASSISETEEGLSFVLFDEGSPYYTGTPIHVSEYGKRAVSSSMGQMEVRYKVKLLIRIQGRRIRATVTLADRSMQAYPVLIGRNVLKNKFTVDVARGGAARNLGRAKRRQLDALTEEME